MNLLCKTLWLPFLPSVYQALSKQTNNIEENLTWLTNFTWSQKVGAYLKEQGISVKNKEHVPELWWTDWSPFQTNMQRVGIGLMLHIVVQLILTLFFGESHFSVLFCLLPPQDEVFFLILPILLSYFYDLEISHWKLCSQQITSITFWCLLSETAVTDRNTCQDLVLAFISHMLLCMYLVILTNIIISMYKNSGVLYMWL